MRAAFETLDRYIATSSVSKHRVFAWLDKSILPDHALIVTARADDTTFGILQSRFHELWALGRGTSLEDRPRYTPTTCFEEFPFPSGLTPVDTEHQRTEAIEDGARIPAGLQSAVQPLAATIATAAKRLDNLRKNWLNPQEWTQHVPEIVPLGMRESPYPDRIEAKMGFEKELAKRTLTNLYNHRPGWLDTTHKQLDAAVANAYGWNDYTPEMPDDEILRRLLALNLARA
jgi:hypothetical protein